MISSPFTLLGQQCETKNIGISHGIYWDHEPINKTATSIAAQANHFDRIVSVDTATINFLRSHYPVCAKNIDYIPNYVDLTLFKPTQNDQNASQITILYPRRLYGPRGFWVVCKILPKILKEFNHVSFVFCGKGEGREINEVLHLKKKYSNRVKYMTCQPYEMNTIYQQADIVLIPTVNSEGTSLSLIEAMATRKAIIATCVGGIPDLITDRFTGLLVKPDDDEALLTAVRELVVNQELRDSISENAYKKSFAFSLSIWKEKWKKTIHAVLDFIPSQSDSVPYNFSLLHLAAGDVVFHKMKQRPQQLFLAISKYAKCFFIEDKKGNKQSLINKNLVLSENEVCLDITGMICYTYLASNVSFFKDQNPQLLIYDVLDHPAIHNNELYLEQHQEMLDLASIIITSSEILFEKYKDRYRDKSVRYVPNAVTIEDFSKKQTRGMPKDFPKCSGKKVIGYYGAISDWFDYQLIEKIASIFDKNAQVILIGPCRDNFPEKEKLSELLQSHENISYLGEKAYHELCFYGSFFDVSMIPFIINDVTLSCSPVKLFEYMAIGAPIVTTDLPECRKYKSAMVAKNHDAFIDLINKALNLTKKDKYFHNMKREAKENTWDVRAEVIIKAINENLGSRR